MSKKFLTKIDATAGAIAPYYEVNVASPGVVDIGKIVWNPIDGTFDMGLLNGVTLQSGQELHFYGKASGTILNGQAVMFAGVEGDHLLMSQAYPSVINDNPQYFIGVATQDFNNNDFGYVTVLGKVRQLDTTAYSLGDVLYFDSESAFTGRLRNTMPTAPNAKIEVAAVVRVHATQGVLMVRPHVMPKLSQVQDVHAPLTDMSNSKVLGWNTNRWEARTVPAVLGYTPVTDARTITINGTTFDLSANRAWTITTDASARTILRYVATASQTTFTISGGYTPGLVDVYQNGAKLDNSTDFTATNGTTIVLTNAAAVNDVIEVYRYQTAFLANNALRQIYEFVATAGQTTFLANYNTGMVDVFYNGSKLVSTEYTAGNGTSIVLGFACNLNDTIEIHAYSYQVGAFTGQAQLNGTGFVKANGTTITYDNSTYLTSINSSQVTTALGYTPYNSTNPSGYITSSALNSYLPLSGGTLTGSLGIGIAPENTYQGLTIYGNNPSVRLKGTATGSWNWIEFVTSSGVNNFSMGVSQSTPLFVIKAGAGLDNPNFAMLANGNIGIATASITNQISGTEQIVKIYNSNAASLYLESSVRGYALTSTASGNLSVYDYTGGAYRMIINPSGHMLVGQTTASGSSNGIYFRPGIESGFIVTNDVALQLSRLGTVGDIQTFYYGTTRVGKVVVAENTVKLESANNGGLAIFSNGNASFGSSSDNVYKLHVGGSIKSNRTVYNWYNGAWQGNGTYWHMKTNMWGGGSPNGNTQYTMSFFKGYMYSYSGSILEGAVGFHNYNGLIYSYKTTGNIFSNVYVSSDGYVVIVVPSGQGETGITIDWHQHWEYPFVSAIVTNAGLHGSTSGKY